MNNLTWCMWGVLPKLDLALLSAHTVVGISIMVFCPNFLRLGYLGALLTLIAS